MIKYARKSAEGYANKGGRTEDLAQAKLSNTLAAAKALRVDGESIVAVEVTTRFGCTEFDEMGTVSETEIASVKPLPTFDKTKDVYVITDADGRYFNKGGLTDDAKAAFTTPAVARLARFSVEAGVDGYIHKAVVHATNGFVTVDVDPEVLVVIPAATADVKVIDDEIVIVPA